MEVALLLGFFFVVVYTLDLGPKMGVPIVGRPSLALIVFIFCFVCI